MTSARGLGAPSVKFTGFGTAFFDFDHDGDLDIVVVNGRVAWAESLPGASGDEYWGPYAEPNFLVENDGRRKFTDASERTGEFGRLVEVSRGLALGDVDGDGDLDLLMTHTGGPARLFRNDAAKAGSWLLVRTVEGKRDAHGAVVTLRAGGRSMTREPPTLLTAISRATIPAPTSPSSSPSVSRRFSCAGPTAPRRASQAVL